MVRTSAFMKIKTYGFTKMPGRKEMLYLTTHSTHFIYGYMVSKIW